MDSGRCIEEGHRADPFRAYLFSLLKIGLDPGYLNPEIAEQLLLPQAGDRISESHLFRP
jgi:hypothetical protein